ncbi:interferon-activable protein 203 isoform X3 [Mus musculus]|uniref:interferon-activable protein 203 isoform X3 n=1 Tax=Mus musculus TaxID=10090 RepID=UPI0003D6F0C4|nr:interferon-activable protein 203 isoform X3 [Mus musculus]|eukprot:XP_006496732.1 PREDICTED: interferon-activable protein 203 isoform X3 [Mus musculus]
MMAEYKNIVLLKGLENMEDYQFRTVKSLLRKELKLTKKMQEDYDRIQLADWIEDKFPKDAGLDKLIKVCEHIKDLKDLAKKLKTEKAKVQKKKEGKCKTAGKKKGQDELSSSESLFNNKESNKSVPSSKKKRKQITKTEGGKKKKLTQEQAQLPETSGTNIKKEEDCLQNPHKSPPTPSSSSSNKKQKNRTIRKHSISKTEGPQEKQQRVELSSISNFQAVSELLTFEGLSAIPSSRLQSSQKPLEAHLDLKMSPISPTSPCHNLPVSLSSDSNVHLNSNAHSILFSGAQVPHVPSATGFSNVGVPLMPSETVFSSSSAPQISQITVPSSIRDLYLPKPAAFNSTEAPHKQAIASRNGQTTRAPSAKLTSKSQFLKLHPPATASSNSQVPHILATMPRNISVTQVPQTRTSSSIQTLNSATVKASKNVQAPQVSLPIRPNYFLASVAPPSATPNRLTSHGPLLSIATSRAQTTQIEPGTESICVQALHAPPSTVSRNKCTTPLTQGAESSTGEALPLPKVKACTIFQAPRVSSPTASSSIMKPHATSSKTSSSLLDQHATSSTASSSRLLALKLSPVTASRALSAIPGLSETIHRSPSSVMTFSSNNIMTEAPRRGTVPKEPSREEGHHQGPKQVMVLKVTEPFTYDFEETKRMFHATVATETEFFRVKVFDTALMSKFIPGKIIAISHYIGCNGFLEIYRASCVSDVNINPTMIISNTLSESAIATPKISYLLSQAKGTFVNGEFVVFKKSERHECICYGIGDDTGKMAVVVYGRLTNVRCEPGSKLRLVCFELTSTKDVCLLRSVRHSYMQVINEGKPLNPDSVRRNSLEPYF